MLGFNKHTESLLCGLGAQDLIPEFKRRDISMDVIHKLTKEDFIKLGATEEQAEHMVNALCISKGNYTKPKLKPYETIADKVEILKLSQKHLEVMKFFIAYCKCRLQKEQIDFFIEPDKALSSSEILCCAVDSLLKEVKEAESKLKDLKAVVVKRKPRSYMWYCISFGGISLTGALLYLISERIVNAQVMLRTESEKSKETNYATAINIRQDPISPV